MVPAGLRSLAQCSRTKALQERGTKTKQSRLSGDFLLERDRTSGILLLLYEPETLEAGEKSTTWKRTSLNASEAATRFI